MMLGARTAAWAKSGEPLPYDAEIEYLESTMTQWIDTGLVWDSDEWKCSAVITALNPVSENYIISQHSSGQGAVYAFAYIHTNQVRLAYRNNEAAQYRVPSDFFGKTYEWNAHYTNGNQTLSIGNLATLSANQVWKSGATQEGMRIIIGGMRDYGGLAKDIRFGRVRIEHGNFLVRDFIPVRFTNERGETEGAMYDRVSGQLFRNSGTGAFIIGPDKTT